MAKVRSQKKKKKKNSAPEDERRGDGVRRGLEEMKKRLRKRR
jgi:hypothetical protein